MAVRTPTFQNLELTLFDDHVDIITWTGLLNTDSGTPIQMPGSSDRSIHFLGTFGAGGTIVLEGSNDGTNFLTLTDPLGNAISKTATALLALTELSAYVRPRVTGGDGTTSLTAILLVKRI